MKVYSIGPSSWKSLNYANYMDIKAAVLYQLPIKA